MKRIILCADDFGQNTEISRGILALAKKERLNAISCMTVCPEFQTHASELLSLPNGIQLGLHFTLTHPRPNLSQLFYQLLTQQIRKPALKAALCLQLESFQKFLGRLPDFIDGHQHIHHFPVVREALLEIYREYYSHQNAWIRVSTPKMNSLKGLAIQMTGARALRRALDQEKIGHNTSFSGVYPFQQVGNYRAWFQKFLNESIDGGLIMCHPGLASRDLTDPLRTSREVEFAYFNSTEFLDDCQNARCSIPSVRKEI